MGNVKSFLLLGLMQLSAGVTPLVAIPFAMKTYTASEYSIFALSLTLGSIFLLITDFGYTNFGTRQIAINRHRPRLCGLYMVSTAIERITLSSIFGILLYFLLVKSKYYEDAGALAILSVLHPIGLAMMPVWAYQGLGRIALMCLSNIVTRVFIILVFIAFREKFDVYIAAALFSCQWMLAGLVFHFLNASRSPLRHKRLLARGLRNFSNKFGDSKYIYGANICIFFYTSFNVAVGGFLLNEAEFNFLFTLDRYVKGVLMVIPPVMGVLLPIFSRWFLAAGDEARVALFRICKWTAFLVIFCILMVNWALLEFADLQERVLVIFLYSLVSLPVAIGSILAVLGMVGRGRNKELFNAVWPAAIFCVLAIVPFIKLFGLLGAAAAIVAAEFLVLLNLMRASSRVI